MREQQPSTASPPGKIFAGLVLLVLVGAALTLVLTASESRTTAAADESTLQNSASAVSAQAPSQRGAQGAQGTDGAQAARVMPGAEAEAETGAEAPKVSPRFARALTDIIELLNADKFAEARAALDPLLTADMLSQMTPFERSRVYQLSFNLNMKDESYDAAQADLYAAIDSGGLTERETSQAAYQIAQLFVQKEDYAKAADSLELWISQPNAQPNKAAYYLLAASYYYQDKYDDARDHMETLMSMPGENQEGWYAMMTALYLKSEDYAKAKPVVEKMVALYGRDIYRDQLADINAELNKVQ